MTTQIRTKKRSKKYNANAAKIKEALNGETKMSVEEAVKTLFSLEQPNFKDGAMVEFHAKLNINPTKSDQLIRASVTLPHGIGKKVVVAAFVPSELEAEAKEAGADMVGGEELIAEIKKSGKVTFDKAVAHPDMMKKLPAVARILGTAGVMPNPKTGTVGTNVADMVTAIKAGKVDYKNDKTANVHVPVGKINKNFTEEKIVENINAFIDSLNKAKPEAVKKSLVLRGFITTSNAPSIQVI